MDTIETIILTSIVNIIITGLVGGLVIYRIQKKIDATIQKSLVEHQIKFSKIYPRTLEILETYYRKLSDCSRLSYRLGYRIMESLSGENTLEDEKTIKDRDELLAAARDFRAYFQTNHIYLPSALIDELEEINERAGNLVVVSMASVEASKASTEVLTQHLSMSSGWLGVSLEEELSEEVRLIRLILKLEDEFTKVMKRFEKLYKSVAEAEH